MTGRLLARSGGTLTVEHDALEALGWPAMTMDFRAETPVVGEEAGPGDEIRFVRVNTPDGTCLVREIQVIERAMPDDRSDGP